jgi:hypothetical protein
MIKLTKRRIAIEFIYFGVLVFLVIIATGFAYYYQSLRNEKVNTELHYANKQVESKISEIDSIEVSLDSAKIKWGVFMKAFELKFPGAENSWDARRNLSQFSESDSLYVRYKKWDQDLKEFLVDFGFKDFQMFKFFVEDISLFERDRRTLEIENLRSQIQDLRFDKRDIKMKYWTTQNLYSAVVKVLLIAFGLLFLLRYFILGLIWSVRTLKAS